MTVYDKGVLLASEWRCHGEYQSRIQKAANGSLRLEVKLFSQGLKRRGLDYVMRWQGVDVNALFFEVLATYNITNAIQMLLTEDEQAMLTMAERRVYMLWLSNPSLMLRDHFSRTTVWKYITDIRAKTGIDMRSHRRPEKLPVVDLAQITVPENILPIPQWAHGSPHYWAPGTAFFER